MKIKSLQQSWKVLLIAFTIVVATACSICAFQIASADSNNNGEAETSAVAEGEQAAEQEATLPEEKATDTEGTATDKDATDKDATNTSNSVATKSDEITSNATNALSSNSDNPTNDDEHIIYVAAPDETIEITYTLNIYDEYTFTSSEFSRTEDSYDDHKIWSAIVSYDTAHYTKPGHEQFKFTRADGTVRYYDKYSPNFMPDDDEHIAAPNQYDIEEDASSCYSWESIYVQREERTVMIAASNESECKYNAIQFHCYSDSGSQEYCLTMQKSEEEPTEYESHDVYKAKSYFDLDKVTNLVNFQIQYFEVDEQWTYTLKKTDECNEYTGITEDDKIGVSDAFEAEAAYFQWIDIHGPEPVPTTKTIKAIGCKPASISSYDSFTYTLRKWGGDVVVSTDLKTEAGTYEDQTIYSGELTYTDEQLASSNYAQITFSYTKDGETITFVCFRWGSPIVPEDDSYNLAVPINLSPSGSGCWFSWENPGNQRVESTVRCASPDASVISLGDQIALSFYKDSSCSYCVFLTKDDSATYEGRSVYKASFKYDKAKVEASDYSQFDATVDGEIWKCTNRFDVGVLPNDDNCIAFDTVDNLTSNFVWHKYPKGETTSSVTIKGIGPEGASEFSYYLYDDNGVALASVNMNALHEKYGDHQLWSGTLNYSDEILAATSNACLTFKDQDENYMSYRKYNVFVPFDTEYNLIVPVNIDSNWSPFSWENPSRYSEMKTVTVRCLALDNTDYSNIQFYVQKEDKYDYYCLPMTKAEGETFKDRAVYSATLKYDPATITRAETEGRSCFGYYDDTWTTPIMHVVEQDQELIPEDGYFVALASDYTKDSTFVWKNYMRPRNATVSLGDDETVTNPPLTSGWVKNDDGTYSKTFFNDETNKQVVSEWKDATFTKTDYVFDCLTPNDDKVVATSAWFETVFLPTKEIPVPGVTGATYKYDKETRQIIIKSSNPDTEIAFEDAEDAPWYGATNVKEIVFGDNISSIGKNAANNIPGVEKIIIGKDVNEIDASAFINNSSLKEFEVADENATFADEDGVVFSKDGTTLIKYPQAAANDPYCIPADVTTVESGAFCGPITATRICFPPEFSGVDHVIKDGAFFHINDTIEESRYFNLEFESIPPAISDKAFEYDTYTAYVNLYRLQNKGWDDTKKYGGDVTYKNIEGTRALSDITTLVAKIDDQQYTGQEIKPKAEVTYDLAPVASTSSNTLAYAATSASQRNLVEGVDYELSYSNNVDPGSATVTVTGIGIYKDSVNKTFQIVGEKPGPTPTPTPDPGEDVNANSAASGSSSTGDNMAIYFIVALVACGAIATVVTTRRMRNR